MVRRSILSALADAALLSPASPAGAGTATRNLPRVDGLAAHGQVRDHALPTPARACQAAVSGWGGASSSTL